MSERDVRRNRGALVRRCAPTLACLKTGSLFTCAFADRADMTSSLLALNRCLRDKGVRVIALRYRAGRALIYMFRRYRRCTEDYMRRWRCGCTLREPSVASPRRRLKTGSASLRREA